MGDENDRLPLYSHLCPIYYVKIFSKIAKRAEAIGNSENL